MSFTDWFEWMGLERFLGPHAKVIVAVIGLVVVLGTLAGYIFRYLHARILDSQNTQLKALLDEQGQRLNAQQTDLDKKNAVLQQAADVLKGQRTELSTKEAAIAERERKLNDVRGAFHGKEHELWCMHSAREPQGYYSTLGAFRRKKPIVLVANLKGGVGKSTLTANLAAFFHSRRKRVLLIDADYQGSLSNMLLLADGNEEAASEISKLLHPGSNADSFRHAIYGFKRELFGSSIISSKYELAALENRLMIEYLLEEDGKQDDGRYRLANLLLDDHIADTFDIALIDAPPRLTAATINGFCASTHLLVPTVFDKLSAEAVGTFLASVQTLKHSLNHSIDVLGVVGTLAAYKDGLNGRERVAKEIAQQQAARVLGPNVHFFSRHVPRKEKIAQSAGDSIAFFKDAEVREIFEELGTEISQRLGIAPQPPADQPSRVHQRPPTNGSALSAPPPG